MYLGSILPACQSISVAWLVRERRAAPKRPGTSVGCLTVGKCVLMCAMAEQS